MLSIEEVGFICVSIKTDIPIIKRPIDASILGLTKREISHAAINPIRQTIALGNIAKPDIEGL